MRQSDSIQRALKLPKGARFYRCALQVNPFDYTLRHNKSTSFRDEDSYNKALLESCRTHGV